MFRKISFHAVLFYMLTLWGMPLKADTLYLKNGDIVSGKILSFQEGKLSLVTSYGNTASFPTADITALKTDLAFDAVFDNGEQARGAFNIDKHSKTWIQSESFGTAEINPQKIKSLVRAFEKKNTTENSASPSGEASSLQEYGKKSDKEPPLDFLTGSTVLLSSGKYEVDFGLRYRNARQSYALNQGYNYSFSRSSYTARELDFELSLRGGLTQGIEGFLSVPLVYSRVDDVSSNEFVRHKSSGRVGDIQTGLQFLLYEETANLPAISLSLGASIPTGTKEYRNQVEAWKAPLDNGSGHWRISSGLSFVRTSDPALMYGGLTLNHSFQKTIDGFEIQPGPELSAYVGLGFALNEKLSLGSRLSWGYVSDIKVNGERMHGTSYEPLGLSLTGTYRLSPDWVVTPQVAWGLNNDSGSPTISLRFSRKLP